ncbi:MAG: hypothetical protein ACKOPG_00965, partial [Novosphingobium sp.]
SDTPERLLSKPASRQVVVRSTLALRRFFSRIVAVERRTIPFAQTRVANFVRRCSANCSLLGSWSIGLELCMWPEIKGLGTIAVFFV